MESPLPTCDEHAAGCNKELREQYSSETRQLQNSSVPADCKDELDAKVRAFQKSILAAAEHYGDKRPHDAKNITRSPELDPLFP